MNSVFLLGGLIFPFPEILNCHSNLTKQIKLPKRSYSTLSFRADTREMKIQDQIPRGTVQFLFKAAEPEVTH